MRFWAEGDEKVLCRRRSVAAGKRDRYGLFEEENVPHATCPKFTYKWILGNWGPSAKDTWIEALEKVENMIISHHKTSNT